MKKLLKKDNYKESSTDKAVLSVNELYHSGVIERNDYETLVSYSASLYIENELAQRVNKYFKNTFLDTMRRTFAYDEKYTRS